MQLNYVVTRCVAIYQRQIKWLVKGQHSNKNTKCLTIRVYVSKSGQPSVQAKLHMYVRSFVNST